MNGGFTYQSRAEHNLELAQSHGREQSEQSWLDSFMEQTREIDKELRDTKSHRRTGNVTDDER